MTHEMLAKARANAERVGGRNVEFRLGEIEHLPIADNTADVVISNCVINLVPDKEQVYREVLRVLKPGGRIAIADVVNVAPLPPELASDATLLCTRSGQVLSNRSKPIQTIRCRPNSPANASGAWGASTSETAHVGVLAVRLCITCTLSRPA